MVFGSAASSAINSWYGVEVRFGLTEERTEFSQRLFLQYGGAFVFTARFLPFLRNMGAMLAGANCMAQHRFYSRAGRRLLLG